MLHEDASLFPKELITILETFRGQGDEKEMSPAILNCKKLRETDSDIWGGQAILKTHRGAPKCPLSNLETDMYSLHIQMIFGFKKKPFKKLPKWQCGAHKV